MENIDFNNPISKSKNLTEENILKLKELFPEIFTEGKIDFEVLQELLGNEIETNEERYHFNWAGKAQARREAQKVSTGTLRPCKEESIDFDTTENLYIEGDNLEVLKLLQKSYYKKIKMIYIDPPYNTGKDFVYKDDYRDNLKNYENITKQRDELGNKLSTNPESDGRYHSNWLNMIYPRLKLARNLLREDGCIFISIDDKEVNNLRIICDEIFGEENFLALLPWKGRGGGADDKNLLENHEFVLFYVKNCEIFTTGRKIKDDEKFPKYDMFKRKYYKIQLLRKWGSNSKRENRPNLYYPIRTYEGIEIFPMLPDGTDGCWRWSTSRMETALAQGDIEFIKKSDETFEAYEKIYKPEEGEFRKKLYSAWLQEEIYEEIKDFLETNEAKTTSFGTKQFKLLFEGKALFDFPKPTALIKILANVASVLTTDIILDFFSGSATTAHAVLELNKEDGGNRKFICVQLPEPTAPDSEAYKAGYKTIAEIGKERIRRVIKKIKEEKEDKLDFEETKLDLGFKVLKLDSSNIVSWDPETKDLQRTLLESVNNIKEDRTNEDVLFEILLKLGLPLTINIEEMEIENAKVYIIGNGELFVCLDTIENLKVADGIVEIKNELNPEVCRVVFRNTGFIDDIIQTNTIQILKRGDIQTVLSI